MWHLSAVGNQLGLKQEERPAAHRTATPPPPWNLRREKEPSQQQRGFGRAVSVWCELVYVIRSPNARPVLVRAVRVTVIRGRQVMILIVLLATAAPCTV